MKYGKAWFLISAVSGASLLLVIVSYFFIEVYANGFAAGLLAFTLAVVNLVSLIYSSRSGHHKVAFGQCLVLLLLLTSIFFSVSRTIWFGREVGSTYLGQDAGFQRLTFYSRGTCIAEWGGIGGASLIEYGNYMMNDSAVYLPGGWSPDTQVDIDGQTYTVFYSENVDRPDEH